MVAAEVDPKAPVVGAGGVKQEEVKAEKQQKLTRAAALKTAATRRAEASVEGRKTCDCRLTVNIESTYVQCHASIDVRTVHDIVYNLMSTS